ncbi:hypothetical protein ACIBL3_47235, partial [Kribbella sp. NPDC050124]|uniref:hypothetical protein n=1 Tax=Kribbella sp. NPDC050124 TaxID=3364114 RepID=UPI0037B5036E
MTTVPWTTTTEAKPNDASAQWPDARTTLVRRQHRSTVAFSNDSHELADERAISCGPPYWTECRHQPTMQNQQTWLCVMFPLVDKEKLASLSLRGREQHDKIEHMFEGDLTTLATADLLASAAAH